jgi:uncharacterized damage-inducible protein DinB
MTYYGSKDLAAAFRTVRNNTIKIAEDIPESQYGFKPAPDSNSISQTLTHIAVSTNFQQHVHENKVTDMRTLNFVELFQMFKAEESKTRTKAELIAFLKSQGDAFASYLESVPESVLAEQVTMPPGAQPETKSRFEMLLSAKEHEMHHRGQLMTMQRMNGIVPHTTREMQARMARMAEAAAPAQA